jgi:hypothetical protein
MHNFLHCYVYFSAIIIVSILVLNLCIIIEHKIRGVCHGRALAEYDGDDADSLQQKCDIAFKHTSVDHMQTLQVFHWRQFDRR